jgi:CBS domain-containing protein
MAGIATWSEWGASMGKLRRPLILIKAEPAATGILASTAAESTMQAQEVMTRDVATVHPRTPVAEAVAKMAHARISGLPVLDDDGLLVGILTEGDLLRRVELGTAPHHSSWLTFLRGPGVAATEYVRTHSLTVEDIMTRDPASVAPEASLSDVVNLMENSHVRRVTVLKEGRLLGIVSRADLVRALARRLEPGQQDSRPDDAVRAEIINELNRQGWRTMCNVKVSVQDGKVTLQGIAQAEPVNRAIRVAAESVAGVVEVDNQVTTLDPAVTAMGA